MTDDHRASRTAAHLPGALLLASLLLGGPIGSAHAGELLLRNPSPTNELPSRLVARTSVLPFRGGFPRSGGTSAIQTWSGSVTAGQDGLPYAFTLVGRDVAAGSSTTTIKTVVVPVVVSFADTGDVFDPRTPTCGEVQSALSGAMKGPVFRKLSYTPGGTFVGRTQYIDALQREQFWTGYTNPGGPSPNYHLLLKGKALKALSVTASGFPVVSSGTCGALGLIEIGAWDNYVQTVLFPALVAARVDPTTFPIFLVKNVAFYIETPSSCCAAGYHSAFNNPSFGGNVQTYAVADYDSSGNFGSGALDGTVLSHEVAEWANDPYGDNPTPPWGNIGQVSGCQSNLEDGDPLTGSTFPVTIGTKTYHLQELAFLGWFFDSPGGVNGWFSTQGTLTAGAPLCP